MLIKDRNFCFYYHETDVTSLKGRSPRVPSNLQSSRKVQDYRKEQENFHFVPQKLLVCPTNVLWI